ncbi:rhomboid family intramembrane serine protease [Amycolatopsis alkalitolerans]|uniref:Rhomboid family intramembrane serine protease n=1 Tax=Amycolatopsis alkalitolerans TaxID=2547244 RepID=A0A5C4M603_9PSEU|nr:rhomboid family intramembrane serine protease [Amycolatopsis alkalitolerans]TNC26962.1 rhomboid family intramembrane serine protease [Amycolatopsis alkalitolerans]
MIPVHDVNPLRRTPWITYGLVAANVVVFLLMPAAARTLYGNTNLAQLCDLQAFVERWGAVPHELLTNQPPTLVPTGQAVVSGQGPGCLLGPPGYHKVPALSVLTSMFLHSSWAHLLGNMLFLAIFGNNVEDRLGRLRFLLFYLVCGYAAGYGFALTDPSSAQPLVGASGAIAGVLGAYIVIYPRARVWGLIPVLFFLPLRVPAWLMLGMWFILQAFYATGYGTAQAGSVAYAAHVAGFVVGALLGFTLRRRPRARPGGR